MPMSIAVVAIAGLVVATAPSVDFALPPIKVWVEERLQALIGAPNKDQFETAFNAFVADKVKIEFNGVELSREQYKKQVMDERVLERSATVKELNSIDTPVLNQKDSVRLFLYVFRLR